MTISEYKFKEIHKTPEDTLWCAKTPLGTITVLKRMTGWTRFPNDIETGFKDNDGKFWLASGMFDIRNYPDLELSQAIDKIKEYANTCIGV